MTKFERDRFGCRLGFASSSQVRRHSWAVWGALLIVVLACGGTRGLAQALGDDGSGTDPTEEPSPEGTSRVGVSYPFEEYANRIRVAEQVDPLTSVAFGDSVSLYNGQTEFANVDIDVPGNSGLPVQLRRRFAVTAIPIAVGLDPQPYGGMGNWDIDVPYISGVFQGGYGWEKNSLGVVRPRCSTQFLPGVSGGVRLADVWSGNSVHIPGEGDRELMWLAADGARPTAGGPHYWTTSNFDVFSCTGYRPSAQGEGFIMRTPDGLTYTFDVRITRSVAGMQSQGITISRARIYLLASRIEDRYGNWVSYAYNDNGHPTTITANSVSGNDLRSISFVYAGAGSAERLTSATANNQTWTYQYDGTRLTGVTLPDLTSKWSYAYTGDIHVLYDLDGPVNRQCNPPAPGTPIPASCCPNTMGLFPHGARFGVEVTHPAGAKATFSFAYQRHGRSGVPTTMCAPVLGSPLGNYAPLVPFYYDLFSLSTKVISGTGIPSQSWSYAYGEIEDMVMWQVGTVPPSEMCVNPEPCPSCQNLKTVSVTQPDGSRVEYDFGVLYNSNDGRLLETRNVSQDDVVMRAETNTYITQQELTGQPFTCAYGNMLGGDDPAAERIRPIKKVSIVQDGSSYTRENPNLSYDGFARWTETRRRSFTDAVTEITAYKDDTAKWILGQIQSVHVTAYNGEALNKWPVVNTYNADVQLETQSKFGKLQWTLGYHATDGTLASVTDGNGHSTLLTDYKRGVPRHVDYAIPGQDQSAGVDDFGRITSVTNEMDYTTTYQYDAVGRLTAIIPPTVGPETWNATTRQFLFEAEPPGLIPESGIDGKHWRRIDRTGNARQIVYYDGLMRPILTVNYDGAHPDDTYSFVKRTFDHAGRETFVSYPWATHAASAGTHTEYDAIGRPTRITANAESGVGGIVETTIDYLSLLRKRVTDPKLNTTTTWYRALDTPVYDTPSYIEAPEGQITRIVRDAFGKPKEIRRENQSTGLPLLTRTYTYDPYERLCKTLDPESGATIQGYDEAGNVVWNVKGTNWNGTSCTGVAANQRTTFAYDARNRLLSTTFPAASGTSPITNTYHADGALKTTTTNGATWTYDYNNRRLLTAETLDYDGHDGEDAFRIDWYYDANAHIASMMYPDEALVAFAPNSIGQPTRAGDFASDVIYHPNGAMKSFTYGNGIVHSLTQNTRQLPLRSHDGAALDLSYAYDENANVAGIDDQGALDLDRTMGYDDRDRLVAASGPWGAASFSYDALDNLQTANVGARACTYHYDGQNRLQSLSGANCSLTYGSYDARGNVLSRTYGGTTQAFAFDYANRMTAAVNKESYQYDGLGHRVRIRGVGGSPKRYQIYSKSGQLLYSKNTADGSETDYIYLNGSLIARSGGGAGGEGLDPPAPMQANPNPTVNRAYVVSWGTVNGAARYRLEECTGTAVQCTATLGTWVEVQEGVETSKSYTGKLPGFYAYRARGCVGTDATSCGPYSAIVVEQVSPVPVLNGPELDTDGDYTVSWNAIPGADSYGFAYRTGTSGSWWEVPVTGTEVHFEDKAPGTYQYKARACADGPPEVCGGYGPFITVVVQYGPPPGSVPGKPRNLNVTPAISTDGDYTVSWGYDKEVTEGYRLEESFDGGAWQQRAAPVIASWSPNPPKTQNGVYSYRVRGCNEIGCGSWSCDEEDQDPALCPSVTVDVFPPPGNVWARPESVQVPLSGPPATYKIKWDAVADATWYEVKRRDSCGGPTWYDPADYPASPAEYTAYIPAGCDDSANFYYSVRACKTGRCSDWSGLPEAAVHVTHGQIDLTGTAQATYLHTDALGSVVAETDGTGTVTQRFHYEPYGAPTDGDFEAFEQNPGYTGHVMDGKTGLVYMQQRYMDPVTGRFISTDPVGVDAASGANFNRYNYAANNPYRFTDPDGRCPADAPTGTCIMSTHSAKSSAENVKGTGKLDSFIDKRSTRMTVAPGRGATEESGYAVTSNESEEYRLKNLSDTKSEASQKGDSLKGTAPDGTEAIVHGHLGYKMTDQFGLGDSGVPIVNGMPNYTVNVDGSRVGVHEIENGSVQFRMIRGKLTGKEITDMTERLNSAQDIYNDRP